MMLMINMDLRYDLDFSPDIFNSSSVGSTLEDVSCSLFCSLSRRLGYIVALMTPHAPSYSGTWEDSRISGWNPAQWKALNFFR
jgi:hypothetical protein